MNDNTVLTNKPSDSSLARVLSREDKLAGEPQMQYFSLEIITYFQEKESIQFTLPL